MTMSTSACFPRPPTCSCLSICLAQMMDPAMGGRSRTVDMREALLCGYWILNLVCSASMSSLTHDNSR